MLNTNVLVLNRGFLPIDVTTVRRAFCMLYQGIGRAVDEEYATFDFKSWSELSIAVHHETIGLVDRVVRVPRVILLSTYNHIPRRHIRFSRHNIYLRDNNTCQYCGQRFSRKDLNLDHLVPRSRGGRSNWENVVTSCVHCNRQKGGHLVEEVNMMLQRIPQRPRWNPVASFGGRKGHYREWLPFLNTVDFSYWNVELEQD